MLVDSDLPFMCLYRTVADLDAAVQSWADVFEDGARFKWIRNKNGPYLAVDGEIRGWFRALSQVNHVKQEVFPDTMKWVWLDEFIPMAYKKIPGVASEGDAIFIGRASDYVLRDMHTLDVFISAPMEERIRNVAGRLSISGDEAEKLIRRKDKSRSDYYNFYTFGDNWGVASNYDLCIDSSILGFRGTAEFIIDFGRKCGYLGE